VAVLSSAGKQRRVQQLKCVAWLRDFRTRGSDDDQAKHERHNRKANRLAACVIDQVSVCYKEAAGGNRARGEKQWLRSRRQPRAVFGYSKRRYESGAYGERIHVANRPVVTSDLRIAPSHEAAYRYQRDCFDSTTQCDALPRARAM
jgi:hypothetical protein